MSDTNPNIQKLEDNELDQITGGKSMKAKKFPTHFIKSMKNITCEEEYNFIHCENCDCFTSDDSGKRCSKGYYDLPPTEFKMLGDVSFKA